LPVLSHITCRNYRSGDPRTHPLGSIYLIGRYYDPATGQFLSVDPMVEQTLEAFGYAGDNPVNENDPNGMTGGSLLGCAVCAKNFNSGGNPIAVLEDAYKIVNKALNGALGQIDQGALGFMKGSGALQECGSRGVGDQLSCDVGVLIGAALELGAGAGDESDQGAAVHMRVGSEAANFAVEELAQLVVTGLTP
jgi:RHS repeat-associated protein